MNQNQDTDPSCSTRSYSLQPLLRPSGATLTGVLAAAMVPQATDAALVTVGGDGGVGTVTLDPRNNDRTNLGGLLLDSLYYSLVETDNGDLSGVVRFASQINNKLFPAVRSSVSTDGGTTGSRWLLDFGTAAYSSDDNWVPGHFRVNGVNNGDLIWGWLHVRLVRGLPKLDPTIISFTYDDEATDTTPFTKPIGGFSVGETDPVPEPSTLGLFGLGLGAAFVSRMRRRKKNGNG